MEDLSPEGINRTHGKPVWTCWGCKTETGLHWHNGWSVAMCSKPECAAGYNEMVAAQVAEQQRFDDYVAEVYGPAR
jgi:hypothetical protein